MRRDLRPSPVNGPVSLGDYTRPMKIKHILTAFTAVTAGAAAVSLAQAQQAYPVQQAPVYSQAPAPYPYPPNGYPSDYGRGRPNFDALEDAEANAAALPPPGPARAQGPILSPDDPRYANAVPSGAAPSGPVMSPDDPRYGRLPGPPPVIYADRPPGAPPQYYQADRNFDPNAPRPPGAVGAEPPQSAPPPAVTGSVQGAPQAGPDGRPL